ncbi:hypothetical protein [Lactococcus garvieae]|uniref:hypothetical protein n=1 Tax=Lactococcus garvieae TaxID=1363 RepID=UPI00254B0E7B|nr:hypothetical protein [Lactococcus garvieae]
MTYEKQTWNKYDDLKTEEENIQNGAVVTDNRMNHMEDGISAIDLEITSHESNKTNPHSVTKEQVGLSNVSNYGIATEAEAIAGTSNAKYMTPSLTKKAAKSYVDKTDVGLSNVDNVKQASKSEFDEHTANKNNPHSVTATQVGAYTISETDAKFKLTINDSGAIAAGTDLNSINISGFYVISARKPDTEITNYPPDVSLNSAGAMYAQIIVYKNASSGMILQHFLDNVSGNMYMRKYYSNSWSIWKKIAIDSEVVHLTGDETIAGKKTFTDETTVSKLKAADIEVTKSHAASSSIYNGNGLINFSRAGNMVQVSVRSMPSIPVNTRITGVIPIGYRPLNDYVSITKPSKNFYFYPNGDVGTGSDALTSADGYYSFCYPTADAVPVD